jgi:hypothetical protein
MACSVPLPKNGGSEIVEIEMKATTISAFIAAAAVFGGTLAVADDSLHRATPTEHQSLKACIEKQKTADVTMSKSEMTRLCKEELKREKQFGVSEPPPVDAPRE